MTTDAMHIRVVHHDDCPNWRVVMKSIRRAVASGQLDAEITHEVADAAPPHGLATPSPTILVDGVDLFPLAATTAAASCRLYPTPSGLRGAPTAEQVRTALAKRT